jgi:transcriptional regulator with XRE-family HTH domain
MVLRELRKARDMTGRHLAETAELSHTQISRIESGRTATPSVGTLRRLADALNFNDRPLLILAGHRTGDDARADLRAMLAEHAGVFESGGEFMELTRDQAAEIVSNPTATHAQLCTVAAELALWMNAEDDDDALDDEQDPELRGLLDIWRVLEEPHRTMIVRYAHAIRDVHLLEFSVSRQRLIARATPNASSAGPFSERDLRSRGFEGFVEVASLPLGAAGVPRDAGVYAVVRRSTEPPSFRSHSVGGHFKGRNPTVPAEKLSAKWIDSPTVYIGRAKTGLRTRLDQLARFARGEPKAHWGGRYLWQLADHDELLVCWRADPHAAVIEAQLIDEFVQLHQAPPFANLINGSKRT